jgi:hypothetical protein
LCAFVEIPNEEDKLEGAGVYADLGKCAVAGGLQEEEQRERRQPLMKKK